MWKILRVAPLITGLKIKGILKRVSSCRDHCIFVQMHSYVYTYGSTWVQIIYAISHVSFYWGIPSSDYGLADFLFFSPPSAAKCGILGDQTQ